MTAISITILDRSGQIKSGKNDYEDIRRPLTATAENYVYLATQDFQFEEGDQITVTLDQPQTYLMVKLEETLDSTLIYVKDQEWTYLVAMTENAGEARPDQRFMGKRHYLSVRLATPSEIAAYRNLALNPHDQKAFSGAYPHASANVETRNDATFFACNAINGIYANFSHGSYPYQSWGINQQADAALKIDFGREVALDKVVVVLRADFPHDNYWQTATLQFSDNSTEKLHFRKSGDRQTATFDQRLVSWVVLKDLQQSPDPSPFPALTEIEFHGQDILAN